jgi:hypothetical protein
MGFPSLKAIRKKADVVKETKKKLEAIANQVGKGDVLGVVKEVLPLIPGKLKDVVVPRKLRSTVKKVTSTIEKDVKYYEDKLLGQQNFKNLTVKEILSAINPEVAAVLVTAKTVGVLDALKTFDKSDWSISADALLKTPIAAGLPIPSLHGEGLSGPIVGYNKETNRIKLSALLTNSQIMLNPYGVLQEIEKATGKKAPKAVEAGAALLGMATTALKNMPAVLFERAQGGGLHYPGSNYIGPGTPVDSAGPPTTDMDALARIHDIHYSYLETQGVDVYKTFNMADRYMLARVDLTQPDGWAVLLGINAKKVFKNDFTPIPPIPSYTEVKEKGGIQSKAWLLNPQPMRMLTEEEIANKPVNPPSVTQAAQIVPKQAASLKPRRQNTKERILRKLPSLLERGKKGRIESPQESMARKMYSIGLAKDLVFPPQ